MRGTAPRERDGVVAREQRLEQARDAAELEEDQRREQEIERADRARALVRRGHEDLGERSAPQDVDEPARRLGRAEGEGHDEPQPETHDELAGEHEHQEQAPFACASPARATAAPSAGAASDASKSPNAMRAAAGRRAPPRGLTSHVTGTVRAAPSPTASTARGRSGAISAPSGSRAAGPS